MQNTGRCQACLKGKREAADAPLAGSEDQGPAVEAEVVERRPGVGSRARDDAREAMPRRPDAEGLVEPEGPAHRR